MPSASNLRHELNYLSNASHNVAWISNVYEKKCSRLYGIHIKHTVQHLTTNMHCATFISPVFFFRFFSTQFHPVKFPPLQLFLIKSSAKMDLFMNPHTFRVNRLKKMVTTFFYVWQFVYFRYSHHFCYKIVYCTSNDTFNFIIIWYMMCMLMYQGWHHCRTDETDDWIRWWFEWCFLTGNYLWHKTYLILNANKDDENWQKHKHFSYFIIHFIYCCLI